ncbi:hypothetical protein LCGC14_0546720 [marine sediment metagenome]|uniref:Uncharacterized protein n=1 Tax=marine sediment metagenome TaxID=412755 RepID=A0A0F9S9Q2_9ZZZZ|nr:hypothetical protein [bacterium]
MTISKAAIKKVQNNLLKKESYQNKFVELYPNRMAILHGKPTSIFVNWTEGLAEKIMIKRAEDKKKITKPKTKTKTKDEIIVTETKVEKSVHDEIEIKSNVTSDDGEYVGSSIRVPKVFTRTYDETWVPIIKKEIEMYTKGEKRTKGFMMLIDGLPKTGKSHFLQSAVEFKGLKTKYRDVPPGFPVYIIEADEAARDETESKWSKYLPGEKYPEGLIHIGNAYVEDPETGLIDPVKTLRRWNELLFGLRNLKQGTVGMDPFSLYCNLVLYVYMIKKVDSKTGLRVITFDEFLKPDRAISIVENQYKKKLIYQVLRKLRKFAINVILLGDVKEEWSQENNLYDRKPTGRYLTDVQKGTQSWVDIIGRFFKREKKVEVKTKSGETMEKTIKKRYLAITDCRFEDKDINVDKYIFHAPTFSQILKHLMRVYPK